MIGFRPLSGHLISKSTIRTVKTLNDGDMFPSPLGASYFQINMARKRMVTRTMFPSPLGASYFQIKGDFIMEENRNEFPSPLGASYFQIRCSRPVRVSKTSFPSPLGASYFQMLPARACYFAGFSDSFAWQIIFLYIFLISNIHNLLQMQYLCGARKNYKLYQYYLNSNFTF